MSVSVCVYEILTSTYSNFKIQVYTWRFILTFATPHLPSPSSVLQFNIQGCDVTGREHQTLREVFIVLITERIIQSTIIDDNPFHLV